MIAASRQNVTRLEAVLDVRYRDLCKRTIFLVISVGADL
jgi:hypothetical protein